MKSRFLPKLITLVSASIIIANSATGQSADSLLDKLVEKGVLTVKEANELREHTDKDFSKAHSLKSGMVFGSAKHKRDWQVGYEYKVIETASLWRGFNDDDFGWNGKGGTDVRGHVVSASYRPFDPLFVNFKAFLTEQINNKPSKLNQQARVQADVVLVF